MYGKALFFVVLVVVGAVLPYILADDQWLSKVENWLASKPQAIVAQTDPETGEYPTKPTTAGKLVPIQTSKKPIRSAVSSLRPDGFAPTNMPGGANYGGANQSMPVGIYGNGGGELGLSPGTVRAAAAASSQSLDASRLVGPSHIPMEHLLSFGVTPDWIKENWAHVTTRLAELELKGWRVPVSLDDAYSMIGSVTYYFDREQQVQRICLHGYTKNPSEIIRLASSRYGMQRIPNSVDELYVRAPNGTPMGGLRLREATLNSGGRRTGVLMELNRLGSPYGMSYEFEQMLRKLQREDMSTRPIAEIDAEQLRMPRSLTAKQLSRERLTPPPESFTPRVPRETGGPYASPTVPRNNPQQWQAPSSDVQRPSTWRGSPVPPTTPKTQRWRNPFFRFPN